MTTTAQNQILRMLDGKNQLTDDDLVKLWSIWLGPLDGSPGEVERIRQALTAAGYLEPVGRHASTGPLWRLTYRGQAKLRKLKEEV